MAVVDILEYFFGNQPMSLIIGMNSVYTKELPEIRGF